MNPDPAGLLDTVRERCARVAEQARFVKIDREAIPGYAAHLFALEPPRPSLDEDRHFIGSEAETTAFILTLDSINFGSGYFPHMRKRPGMSGYFTVASSLTDRFRSGGAFGARELEALTPEECSVIFGQVPKNEVVHELMALFAGALNDLGTWLFDRFDGSFTAAVESADGSAERLAELLVEMPFYRDVSRYEDCEVPFYKRAQIVPADLSLALKGSGLGRFEDLDRLTMFADNLVPHVLRLDGILSYDEALARRIDAEELIPSGSREEVEIRASALHAVELMVDAERKAGRAVREMDADYLLWNRGQQPYYKTVGPRHRARTVFY